MEEIIKQIQDLFCNLKLKLNQAEELRASNERTKEAQQQVWKDIESEKQNLKSFEASLHGRETKTAHVENVLRIEREGNELKDRLEKEKNAFEDEKRKFAAWRNNETIAFENARNSNDREAIRLAEKERTMEADLRQKLTNEFLKNSNN